ncbi:putative membrane protein [Pseudozyma hubeiensis]|nr:putative membrane protein [Pseudozyma hubeiensis]
MYWLGGTSDAQISVIVQHPIGSQPFTELTTTIPSDMSVSSRQEAAMGRSYQGMAPTASVSSSIHAHTQHLSSPSISSADDKRSEHSPIQDVDKLASPEKPSAEPGQAQQAASPEPKAQERQCSLLVQFFPVFLIALQFGMDSTLWLPTAYAHIAKCTSSSRDASNFLSLAQLLPAAVQFFVSLLIGPLAGMAGSLKWPACSLLLCSAVGNFVYSVAAPGAINKVWVIVGARCLLGLASGSSSLAMAYLTISTAADKRIEAMSLFRTFGGVAMVLGPLLSIPLTRVHFGIGHSGFQVDGTNAPTFFAAFTSLSIVCVVALLLEDRSKPAHNAFAPLVGFFTSEDGRWKMPCLVLGLMLVSAYLSASVLFLLSDLLSYRWHIGITLASGIQAIVFALSLLASITCGRLRQWILVWLQKRNAAGQSSTAEAATAIDSSAATGTDSAADKLYAEVVLTQVSQVISVLAVLLILVSVCFKTGSTATAVVFAVACTFAMMGYNIQAASLPSLFSQSLPKDVRASLVPWYAATVAVGKLAAPPVTESIGNSGSYGWAASQSVSLASGLGAVVVLALASKRLIPFCTVRSSE